MTDAKQWHDCPCGESIAVGDTPFAQRMLALWEAQHAGHTEHDHRPGYVCPNCGVLTPRHFWLGAS